MESKVFVKHTHTYSSLSVNKLLNTVLNAYLFFFSLCSLQ